MALALIKLEEWRSHVGGAMSQLASQDVEELHMYCDSKYMAVSPPAGLDDLRWKWVCTLSGVSVPSSRLDAFLRISQRVRAADDLLHRYGKEYRLRIQVASDPDLLSPEEQEVLDIYRETVGLHLAKVREARDAEVTRHKAVMASLVASEAIPASDLGPFARYHELRTREVARFEPDDIVAAFNSVGGDVKKMKVAMKAAKRDATTRALPDLAAARIFRVQHGTCAATDSGSRSATTGSA